MASEGKRTAPVEKEQSLIEIALLWDTRLFEKSPGERKWGKEENGKERKGKEKEGKGRRERTGKEGREECRREGRGDSFHFSYFTNHLLELGGHTHQSFVSSLTCDTRKSSLWVLWFRFLLWFGFATTNFIPALHLTFCDADSVASTHMCTRTHSVHTHTHVYTHVHGPHTPLCR